MDLSADVLFPDGIENMGGVTKRAFIGRVSDFTTIATPIAVPVAYEDRVLIPGPHVLAAGKKLIETYIMYDKSGIESPSQGTRKGMSSKPKFTLVLPGNLPTQVGLLDFIKNDDLLVFAEQQDGDGYIQIGTERLPACVTSHTVTTGTSPDAEKSITIVVEAPSHAPYYFYTGDLPRVGADEG